MVIVAVAVVVVLLLPLRVKRDNDDGSELDLSVATDGRSMLRVRRPVGWIEFAHNILSTTATPTTFNCFFFRWENKPLWSAITNREMQLGKLRLGEELCGSFFFFFYFSFGTPVARDWWVSGWNQKTTSCTLSSLLPLLLHEVVGHI